MSTLDVDDDPTVVGTSAWIERDQFVYFVTMARELGDPGNWATFRDELVAALKAAWGLDAVWLDLPVDQQRHRRLRRMSDAYQLVDESRSRHDPATNWDGFVEALWNDRGSLTNSGLVRPV